MASSDCPCPLERKVLIQTMNEIVEILSKDAKKRKECELACEKSSSGSALSRCAATTRLPLVTCTRNRNQAPCVPCEDEEQTAMVPYSGAAAEGTPLKACKSSELRAGVFYSECRCLKRDGLQRACRRNGCSDRCGFVRPASRQPLPLGTAVPGYSLRPVCCPGEKEASRLKVLRPKTCTEYWPVRDYFRCLQYLHAKADLRVRDPPLPPLDPLPLPPAPAYNWTGTFEHKCKADSRCPRRKAPIKYPCGGAKCKHWEVPEPCTLPICKAACFEQPPGWPTFCR